MTLRKRFAIWIRQLIIPSWSETGLTPLKIDPTARFLNFNYTPSLERLYGVPSGNIVYVHGSAVQPNEDIILGHGWHHTPEDFLNRHVDPEAADVRVMEGNRIIDDYFSMTFKPTEEIIARNRPFWASCASASEIFVLGHSLAPVDQPYFCEIIGALARRPASWTVSTYGPVGDKPDQLAALGVPGAAVRFVQLTDLA